MEAVENSPGVIDRVGKRCSSYQTKNSLDVDRAQEPYRKKSPGVDRVQEPIEFPDLESALAEIARLRTQNDELLSRVRSQSEKFGSPKTSRQSKSRASNEFLHWRKLLAWMSSKHRREIGF
jgi:hypothetical protein